MLLIRRGFLSLLLLALLLVSCFAFLPMSVAATTFFSDGFSSGNFAAWTGIEGSPTVQSSTYHHSSTYPYAMLADLPGEDCYRMLDASRSVLYMQFYVYISTLPSSGNFVVLAEIGQGGTYWGYGTMVGIRYYSGSARFAFLHGYTGAWVYTNVVPKVNTWYCVQIKAAQSQTQILYINDVQVATMGQGYLSLNRVRVGAHEATYYPNTYFDCVAVSDSKITLETEEPPEPPPTLKKAIYKISIDSASHNNYGLGYPVTYVFQIPTASSNLKVYKRSTTSESWTQLAEKTASEFFNGIECVRFDYSQSRAYVSVAFSSVSDDTYIRITDQAGAIIDTLFSAVSKYYDNRKAAVVVTADDWTDGDWHTDFMSATDVCQARHVWFTPGLNTNLLNEYADIQTQLNEGYLEVASHSRNHPTSVPYVNYDSEIGGSKADIIGNLSLPAIYTRGASEYVWTWLEPQDTWDSTTRAKLGQYKYLIDRHSGKPPGYTDFATWDSVNGVYNRVGIVGYGDIDSLSSLNSAFDSSYTAGGIYHLFFHALGLNWASTGKIPQHLDHLKDKLDVWYAGFGATYAYQFVKEKYTIAAISPDTYSLTVNVVGSGYVNRNNSGPYTYGDVVQLTASPALGWSFSAWNGALSGSTNPGSITMDANKTVTATFTQNGYSLTVTVSPSAGGSVSADKPAPYSLNDVVTLTPIANPGYSFSSWSGDGVNGVGNTRVVTVTGNMAVTATFTQNVYTLTIGYAGEGSGSVSTNKSTPYYYGDIVKLTATPATGSSFSGWSGDISGTMNPQSITIDGNKAVTATFVRTMYTLTISTVGSGSVSTDKSAPYYYGDVVQLTANPTNGWTFNGWGSDLIGSTTPASLTITRDMTVTATFVQIGYSITASVIGIGGTINPSGVISVIAGTSQSFTIEPDPGYVIADVVVDGISQGVISQYTFDAVSKDHSVAASFRQVVYAITASVDGVGGTINPQGVVSVNGGETITFVIAPGSGYHILNVMVDGMYMGPQASFTFYEVDRDHTITATFVKNEYTLTIIIVGSGSVSTNPNKISYIYGDIVSLTAIPNNKRFSFGYWTGDLTGSINPATIVMDSSKTVTATFIRTPK